MEEIECLARENGCLRILLKLSEECAELIQASQKLQIALQDGSIVSVNSELENVYEEVADVEIMIEQAKTILSSEKIKENKEKKVERQLKRFGMIKKVKRGKKNE